MYKSTVRWRDLEDKHLYEAGDAFPHDGREISEDRIAELSGTQNKAGFALIQAVDVADEEKPVEKTEAPKKAVKRARKGGSK